MSVTQRFYSPPGDSVSAIPPVLVSKRKKIIKGSIGRCDMIVRSLVLVYRPLVSFLAPFLGEAE